MTDIQTSVIGKTYLVIGVIYSAMLLGPFAMRKIGVLLPKSKSKSTLQSRLNRPATIITQALISTSVYFITILIILVFSVCGIFGRYLFAKDVTITEMFPKTLATFNKYFWMNGSMAYAYSPVFLSSIVMLIVFVFYVIANKDFVANIEFANIDNGFLQNGKKSTSRNNSITNVEWFRRHYALLVFIAILFMYAIIFLPLWIANKVLYLKCVAIILLVLVGSVASLYAWWVMFFVYILLVIGFVTS